MSPRVIARSLELDALERADPHPAPIARPEGRASFRTPYSATPGSKARGEKESTAPLRPLSP